jgi:cytolysin-activating lysine-acyltransferase
MPDSASRDKFFRATMRHFAQLRGSGPAVSATSATFPADWFDLPDWLLADLGAAFFLISLTRYHRIRSLGAVFDALEPPFRLGQYRMFRSNGYPRAFITWAGLSLAAERRHAVDHLPLRGEDWNSGASVWLIDFVAPFGHIDQIVPMLTANRDLTRLRTLWHNKDGGRFRVVEWSRPVGEEEVKVTSYGAGQFCKLLQGA